MDKLRIYILSTVMTEKLLPQIIGETPGKYIGTYVDFSEADSAVFNKYSWVKIEGPQGVQGPKGAVWEAVLYMA